MGNAESNLLVDCLEELVRYLSPTEHQTIQNAYGGRTNRLDRNTQSGHQRIQNCYDGRVNRLDGHTQSGYKTGNNYDQLLGGTQNRDTQNRSTQNQVHRVIRGYDEYLEDIYDLHKQIELRNIVHDYTKDGNIMCWCCRRNQTASQPFFTSKIEFLWKHSKGEIESYKKINNYFLESMYNLKKDEYISKYGAANVREMTLIHSTAASNVPGIVKDNFNWRKVVRSKYGKGVSFSDDADYANFYSNRSNGTARAFIITKVLVSKICRGLQNLNTLPNGCDTAHGPHVYVKFRDNEFLPQYVLFYDCSNTSQSKYNRNRNHRRR